MAKIFLAVFATLGITTSAVAAPGDVKRAMMLLPNPFCGSADISKATWTSCDLASSGARPATCDRAPVMYADQSAMMCAHFMNGALPLAYPNFSGLPTPPTPLWPPVTQNFELSDVLVQTIRFRTNFSAELPQSIMGDWTQSGDLPADCGNLKGAIAPQETPAALDTRLPNWRSCLARTSAAADSRIRNSAGGIKITKIEARLEAIDPDNPADAKQMNDAIIALQKVAAPGASLDQVIALIGA